MRACLLILALTLAAAARAEVTISTSTAAAQVKEIFYITVRAQGAQIGQPVLPHAAGLTINRNPASSSTQTSVQFINGAVQQTSMQEWVYQAWGTQPGKLEIPPVKVSIGGKDEISNSLTMQIQEGGAPAGAPPSAPAPSSPFNMPQPLQRGNPARRADVSTDDVMLLQSSVSKQTVYEGEAFLYEVDFCVLDQPGIMVRGTEGNTLNLPSADGFYESEISRDEKTEKRNGLDYQVTKFTRTMFATRPGTLEIPGVQWQGRATAPTQLGPRSFALDRTTEALKIEVKPLPQRPPNFSGAVGRFTIAGEIEGGQVRQGVPKTFTIVIAGEGNVDAVPKPIMPAMDWCHVSEPEVTVTPLNSALVFEKRFVYTITPIQPDIHNIPEVSFTFFAPDIGDYKTVSSKPVGVYVEPAKDTGPLVVAGGQSQPTADVQVLGNELLPLVDAAPALAPPRSAMPVDVLGFGAPPLVFAACLALLRRQRRLATDQGYARGLRARSRSRKRLQEAARSKDPGEAIFKALVGFLGDKLNLPDAGMTSHDVRDAMTRHAFPEALTQEYTGVLRTCERYRYAGQALSPQEAAALHDAAAQALDHLEAHTAGGRRA